MGLKTHKTWFDFWQEQEIFLFSRVFPGALGLTQSSVFCILQYYFTGQIQQGHEYDHSPQSNAEVKVSSYVSVLPYALMVWCLIMQRDKFKFTFTSGFIQDAAERTPRLGRVIASGGERVVEQRCTCRFQCTPWCGWENIEPLLLRSL